MPRGVPKNGVRMTSKRLAALVEKEENVLPFETDVEIETRQAERFEILQTLTDSCLKGDTRSLIVSGPAGLGKSFTVERELANWDPTSADHTIIKGFVKATGLFKLLWQHRLKHQVLVFDDADSIFFDDTTLAMLKAVCDTTETRSVSYLADYDMIDEKSAEIIPKTFVFEGTIIFISNMDFDKEIERGHKLAPHLAAMVSRSHYIDLAMKTRRDYLIRIKMVVRQGMLKDRGLTDIQQFDVMEFIDDENANLRELSLRMAIKIADLRKNNESNWKKIARVTCCKNK